MQDKLGVPVVPLRNDFGGIFEFLKTGKAPNWNISKTVEAEFDMSNVDEIL